MSTKIPFGPYEGEPLWNVPTEELRWLITQSELRPRVRRAIEKELKHRDCPGCGDAAVAKLRAGQAAQLEMFEKQPEPATGDSERASQRRAIVIDFAAARARRCNGRHSDLVTSEDKPRR